MTPTPDLVCHQLLTTHVTACDPIQDGGGSSKAPKWRKRSIPGCGRACDALQQIAAQTAQAAHDTVVHDGGGVKEARCEGSTAPFAGAPATPLPAAGSPAGVAPPPAPSAADVVAGAVPPSRDQHRKCWKDAAFLNLMHRRSGIVAGPRILAS